MKRKTIPAIIIALISSGAGASDFVDTAQVIAATPIIERISEPRQECFTPSEAPRKESSVVAPIIGGIVGGLLGHQVGQGSGQTAATIVGATGGAVVGNMIGNRAGAQRSGQRCRTVESTREVINGYNVVYRYNGRDIATTLPYNPGSTVKVGVGIIDDGAADNGRENYRGRSPVSSADPSAPMNNANYNYRY